MPSGRYSLHSPRKILFGAKTYRKPQLLNIEAATDWRVSSSSGDFYRSTPGLMARKASQKKGWEEGKSPRTRTSTVGLSSCDLMFLQKVPDFPFLRFFLITESEVLLSVILFFQTLSNVSQGEYPVVCGVCILLISATCKKEMKV